MVETIINTKICPKCRRELPATLEFFHKEKEGKYGLRGSCKECRNLDRKQYRSRSNMRRGVKGSSKHTLGSCIKIANSRGGACLSNEYKNASARMEWECEKGHKWYAKFNDILNNNSWCPYCAKNKKLTIEKCREVAISRGGKCLSDIYINARTRMLWECSEGHRWEISFDEIKNQGHWCPHCAGLAPHTIEYCKNVGIEKGGKCLSDEYTNNKKKLKWRCENRHIFTMNLNDVLMNHWCPYCSESKFEKECRFIMEKLFNSKFPSRWILSMNGLNGGELQFDGYNPYLKVAFEANGLQHYERIEFWHKTNDDFLQQQKHDKIKEEYAKKHNIKLIIIPYWEKDNLENYIKEEII